MPSERAGGCPWRAPSRINCSSQQAGTVLIGDPKDISCASAHSRACYPWTGQVTCFDSFGSEITCDQTGQDGQYRTGRPWPEPRFEMLDETLVCDRLSGLVWPRNTSATGWPMTWDQSRDWVEERNQEGYLGHNDWRLPGRRELLALISLAHSRPALPPNHPFLGLFQHWHWTATPSASAPGHFWRIHLEGGRMFPGPREAGHMVIPVRGASWLQPEDPGLAAQRGCRWPEPRFTISTDQVLDSVTGLKWFPRTLPEQGETNWQDALDMANRMDGWRVPTILELESLVDVSRAWPALTQGHPFEQELDGVWSSTTSGYDPAWAWVLYFGKGSVGVGHKPGKHFKVLLVHGDHSWVS